LEIYKFNFISIILIYLVYFYKIYMFFSLLWIYFGYFKFILDILLIKKVIIINKLDIKKDNNYIFKFKIKYNNLNYNFPIFCTAYHAF